MYRYRYTVYTYTHDRWARSRSRVVEAAAGRPSRRRESGHWTRSRKRAPLRNRLIPAKEHGAVQLNVGQTDESGRYTGEFYTFAIAGSPRLAGRLPRAPGSLRILKAYINVLNMYSNERVAKWHTRQGPPAGRLAPPGAREPGCPGCFPPGTGSDTPCLFLSVCRVEGHEARQVSCS